MSEHSRTPEKSVKGHYHNDYSPRYHEAYDIYEKAKDHMRAVKKNAHARTDSRKSSS